MSTPRPFSPGEWRVEAESEDFRAAYEIVSEVDGESFWLADVGANPDDADADAQVMAASKALYLALAAVVEALSPVYQLSDGTGVYEVCADAVVQQARAALALVERRV